MRRLKIRTKTGRIITLTVIKELDNGYKGTDLFGKMVIISNNDIESLWEMRGSEDGPE